MLNWQYELDKIFDNTISELITLRKIKSNGIVLYGAGEMGEMAIDLLKNANITPCYVVDKNKTGKLKGLDIISPEQISTNDKKNYTFIICITKIPFRTIYDFLQELGCNDIRHFYDYTEVICLEQMSNGWALNNPNNSQKEKIKFVLKALEHDTYSVAHYLQFLWWRIKRKEVIYSEYPILADKKFFKTRIFPKLEKNEVFVDGGAHFGQTIHSFIEKVDGKYNHIWAFEPDSVNRKILEQHLLTNVSKITLINKALSDKYEKVNFFGNMGYASKINSSGKQYIETITLDSMPEIEPTIIKLHIEGSELAALKGAKETIKKYRPVLMVLADHNADGLYKIPEFIINQNNYQLFFNLHDYCGNSAIFYAYPKEKII